MRRLARWRAELVSAAGLALVDVGAWMTDPRLGATITGVSLLIAARALSD